MEESKVKNTDTDTFEVSLRLLGNEMVAFKLAAESVTSKALTKYIIIMFLLLGFVGIASQYWSILNGT